MGAWLIAVAIALQQPVRDPALAARIPQLFHTATTLDDDDPQVKAAEAELRQMYSVHGIPTIAEVGDEAAYQFVSLLCATGSMNARTRALASAKAALAKGGIPADAVAFCTARIKQDRLNAQAARRRPSNVALVETIRKLCKEDQAVRQPDGFDREKMIQTDREHEASLGAILDRYGVPTYSMVGVEGAGQFVTMIQHQPPEFRRKALPKLKANVDAGEADAGNYTKMYDRAQRDEGRNQRYGEQLECIDANPELREAPIDDEAHVNERRASLGLMRMELYARLVIEVSPKMCSTPSK